MIGLTILSIGKTRSVACAALETEYSKRLTGPWQSQCKYSKNETELLKAVEQFTGTVVLLDEHGQQYDSVEFASQLQRWRTHGPIGFVIGDAPGLPPVLQDSTYKRLALSRLTLPHEFVRAMLLEQLYRATTIMTGHPYHK